MFILIFHVLCFSCFMGSIECVTKVVTTLGPVQGKLVDDEITGAYYYSFEGIPYAEPPVGNLRFKPPVQKRPWSSVRDATKPGYVCPQKETYYRKKEMSEDCLNFNIYTPANYMNKSLPVLVFVHSGDLAFLSGNAEPIFGPQLFMLRDVVLVTMNYRLGALGFLSLCNKEVSGNAGLKDLILLLKIVKKNIASFGGDPNNITIFGEGGGAALAGLLQLTNRKPNLFHKLILKSGSLLSVSYIQTQPLKNAKLLCQELGLKLSNYNDTLKKLRTINAFDIINAQEAVVKKDPQRGFQSYSPFKPTVEIKHKNAVLTRPILEMVRNGEILNVPIMIGFNDQEGMKMLEVIRNEPELINKLNMNFELCIPSDIQYPYGSLERKNLAARIRDFYFNGGDISFHNIQNYLDLMSDTQNNFAVDYFINLYKNKKCGPVYYYIFEGDTELNWYKNVKNLTYPGAAISDDFGYTFLTSVTKPLYKCLDSNTRRVMDAGLTTAINFIYYGIPAPNQYINYWPEAGSSRYHLRQAYEAIPVYNKPNPERLDFWYQVYEEYFNSTASVGSYFCKNDNIQTV